MCRFYFAFTISFLFFLLSVNPSNAGELPPPDTIGVCCLNSELGLCQEVTLEQCFTDQLGFGWSDELTCEPDTCIPDTEGNGNCCSEHPSTACGDLTCSETVCEIDPYCCIFEWDSICVDEANELCGEICQGPTVLVPTLGEWGIILSAILLGISGIFALRNGKSLRV